MALTPPPADGYRTPRRSYHARLGDGKAEEDQEAAQKCSDLDGEAARLALEAQAHERGYKELGLAQSRASVTSAWKL